MNTHHTFRIQGMHCDACMERVRTALSSIDGIESVSVSQNPPEAQFMAASTPDIAMINAILLKKAGKYSLTTETPAETSSGLGFERITFERIAPPAKNVQLPSSTPSTPQQSWFQTYKPLVIVVGFILLGTGISLVNAGRWNTMLAMNTFMGGFFIAFSFFKMLDVAAFANSYSMYDVVAQRWRGWGYAYPFVELTLGIAYFTHFAPVWTNAITLVVMSVSIIGVIQSRLNKRQIQCACLGTVFQLPMSSVTIIEDGVMIGMSALMLVLL